MTAAELAGFQEFFGISVGQLVFLLCELQALQIEFFVLLQQGVMVFMFVIKILFDNEFLSIEH